MVGQLWNVTFLVTAGTSRLTVAIHFYAIGNCRLDVNPVLNRFKDYFFVKVFFFFLAGLLSFLFAAFFRAFFAFFFLSPVFFDVASSLKMRSHPETNFFEAPV